MKKQTLLFYSMFALALNANAQSITPSTLNVSGKTATLATNTYDWSIGEMTMVSTFTTANLIVTQGLLQTGALINGVDNSVLEQSVQLYPNPSRDILYLEANFKTAGNLQYVLTDAMGKTILKKETACIGKEKQTLNITDLTPGYYLLEVIVKQEGNAFNKTYKVQKLN